MPASLRSFDASSHIARPDESAVTRAARDFVSTAREANDPIVLAVSGGRDSMVLMHAVAEAVERDRLAHAPATVLTFDHRTGAHAAAATRLVASEATRLGFRAHIGTSQRPGSTEAEWRAARWRFFRELVPDRKSVV